MNRENGRHESQQYRCSGYELLYIALDGLHSQILLFAATSRMLLNNPKLARRFVSLKFDEGHILIVEQDETIFKIIEKYYAAGLKYLFVFGNKIRGR